MVWKCTKNVHETYLDICKDFLLLLDKSLSLIQHHISVRLFEKLILVTINLESRLRCVCTALAGIRLCLHNSKWFFLTETQTRHSSACRKEKQQ